MSNKYPNEKHQVGAVITKLMNNYNLDESTLAKACKISLASLSRIKNNPDSNPTISTLRPIADYFNISIDQLLGFSPIESKKPLANNIPVITQTDIFNWLDNKTTKQPIKNWLNYGFEISDKSFAIEYNINTASNINNSVLKNSLLIIDPKRPYKHDNLIFIYNKKLKELFIRKIAIDDQNQIFISPIEDGFSSYIALESCSENIVSLGIIVETRLQYCFDEWDIPA